MEKFIPPIFPVAAQCDPSVAEEEEEESTKRQFSIALKAAHCSQGGGMFTVCQQRCLAVVALCLHKCSV